MKITLYSTSFCVGNIDVVYTIFNENKSENVYAY